MLSSLSLPPFNYLIINFLTFSSFLIFLIRKSDLTKNKKLFFFYGWLFGFGYFITNLYWISISLTFDQSFKFLIPFSLVLIPSFLAVFYGLIFYFFAFLNLKSIVSSFFIFSLIFGVIEFLRGIILIPAFLAIFYGLISYLFIILKPKMNLLIFLILKL